MKSHSEVVVKTLPPCDLCEAEGRQRVATYDARIKGGTAWGYLCDDHFATKGAGLGLGIGQRLIVRAK